MGVWPQVGCCQAIDARETPSPPQKAGRRPPQFNLGDRVKGFIKGTAVKQQIRTACMCPGGRGVSPTPVLERGVDEIIYEDIRENCERSLATLKAVTGAAAARDDSTVTRAQIKVRPPFSRGLYTSDRRRGGV